jgi:hypothetical protein
MARNDWGWSIYPMVPGHEIVGRVIEVGSEVTRFKTGDAVAVGCMIDSCQHCDQCRKGEEQLCREGNTLTYNGQDRITQPLNLTPTPDEQTWFNIFRVGIWPEYFPGVQFSRDPEALNQYFRQMTPNTGPCDADVISDAVSALFNRIGPGILVTHSQGGGWRDRMPRRHAVTAVHGRTVALIAGW